MGGGKIKKKNNETNAHTLKVFFNAENELKCYVNK